MHVALHVALHVPSDGAKRARTEKCARKHERLHHTSYCKMGTEDAAWVLFEYRKRKWPLRVRET